MRPEPARKARDEEFLFRLIRACFSQRRKTIRNSLAVVYGREDTEKLLAELHIDPQLRAEDLSLEDYVRLAGQN